MLCGIEKMRRLSYILTILVFVSCNSNRKEQSENIILFPSIDIVFETGDESREQYQIEIYSDGSSIFAKKIEPNYYYGKSTDSTWLVELDSNKVELIREFLKMSKKMNKRCNEGSQIVSSSIDFYHISIENDTLIQIDGNCDWNGFDYFSIEQKLFNEKFIELNMLRTHLKDSIIDALEGKWVVSGLKNELKQNDLLTLERTDELDELEVGTIIWAFGDSLSFNSSDNKVLDFTYSKSYELYVNNGSLDLTIASGAVILPNGNMTIENYGAYLTIEKIEKDKIILNYWWR